MLKQIVVGLAGLMLFLPLPGAVARQAPVKGMVWRAPSDVRRAERDLRLMRAIGVQAVRTDIIRDERLLTLADTLGIHIFQELPVTYLPAETLADSLDYALRELGAALERASRHPSARTFGLAGFADTGNPAACRYFEQLAGRVREQAATDIRLYYTTLFPQHDRCAGSVDFVLIDGRDLPNPVALMQKLRDVRAAHPDVAFGIGALGAWARPGGPEGLRTEHSLQWQARYLEEGLNALLADTSEAGPMYVFVHRWRDEVPNLPSPSHDLDNPYHKAYGLLGLHDEQRPAFEVVKGFYTGRQTVFAFDSGPRPASETPWAALIAWGVFVILAGFYATSPRLRQMLPRYFTAKGFYRDAVREGRDMLLGSSAVLLVALGCSVGVMGVVLLETLRTEPVFAALFQWLPAAFQKIMVALLNQPWMLVLLLGSLYALILVLWSSVLSFASRRRYPLMPGQAMMLVVWPRWPLLLILVGAAVVPSLVHEQALYGVLVLAAAWIVFTVVATLRTVFDYAQITHMPAHKVLLVLLGNPLFTLLLLGGLILLRNRADVEFFTRLITLD